MKKLSLRRGKTVLKILSGFVIFSVLIETPGVAVNNDNESVVSSSKSVVSAARQVSTAKVEATSISTDNLAKKTVNKTENKNVNNDNKKAKDKYKDIGVSVYRKVNIRKTPKTNSRVVATMKKGTSAKILKRGKVWYRVYSAGVVGYVKKGLLVEGEKVNELAKKYAHKVAKVVTETLNVREKTDKNAKIVDQIGEDDIVRVTKDVNSEWIKIKTKSKKDGYVLKEYVRISSQFDKATPVKQKSSKKSNKNTTANTDNNVDNTNNTVNYTRNSYRSYSNNSGRRSYSSGNNNSYSKRSYYSGNNGDVVGYAKRFLGGKYVYGGQSLTNGTDCSGFTRQVYKKFGVNLPRTSSAQRSAGKSVSRSQLKAGDLVCYSGHVAIYAGNGKIVHASDPKGGIKVSNMNYTKPVSYRRVK